MSSPLKTYSNRMDKPHDQQDRVIKAAQGYRSELIAYARSLLGSYSAADDIVQEAMIVVFRKADQFEEGTSLLAWCRAIVRIEALRFKQRQRRERTLAERLLDDAIDAAFEEFQANRRKEAAESWQDALRSCLSKLPAHARGVLRARFSDELSYLQIGEQLGMTIEAVRKSLFRSRRQVRSCVENSLKAAQ